MKALILPRIASMEHVECPLELVEIDRPHPRPNELLLRVSVCGVCHTELDEIEGRLKTARLPIVPGHQVVGRLAEVGTEVVGFSVGDRFGVGWIHCSSGGANENLSNEFVATGCDVDGGYAEYMTVPANYAVPIPSELSDEQAAPLLCAGAIGYRALRLTKISNGNLLGLMGFGASGHLVLQLAKHIYPESPVYVFAREPDVREFAVRLGADWAGDVADQPPYPIDAIIDTTPAWRPIVASLRKLAPGGRLVVNAIRKEDRDKDALMELSYHDDLWMEREIKSVANLTHKDIAEFLPLAAAIPIRSEVTLYPFEKANEALQDLRRGANRGANVLRVEESNC